MNLKCLDTAVRYLLITIQSRSYFQWISLSSFKSLKPHRSIYSSDHLFSRICDINLQQSTWIYSKWFYCTAVFLDKSLHQLGFKQVNTLHHGWSGHFRRFWWSPHPHRKITNFVLNLIKLQKAVLSHRIFQLALLAVDLFSRARPWNKTSTLLPKNITCFNNKSTCFNNKSISSGHTIPLLLVFYQYL